MEAIDYDSPVFSPINSILDSDNEETLPTKKPHLIIRVDALTRKESKGQVSRFLKERENNMENRGFKDDVKEFENKFNEKMKISQKTKIRCKGHPSHLLKINDANMNDKDLGENDETSEPLLEGNVPEKVKEQSGVRSLKNEKNVMDTRDSDDEIKENEPALNDCISNKSNNGAKHHLFRFLKMKEENNMDDKNFDNKTDKKKKSALKRRVSQKSNNEAKVSQSPVLKMSEENDSDDKEFKDEIDNETEASEDTFGFRNKEFNDRHGVLNDNFAMLGPSKKRSLLGASDSDSDSDADEGSLKAIRKENKARMKALVNKLRDPELEKKIEVSTFRRDKSPKFNSAPKSKTRSGNKDVTFKFRGFFIPAETRKSLRIQKKKPDYSYEVLDHVRETSRHINLKRPDYNLDDYLAIEDLEKFVYRPTRKSFGNKRKVEEKRIIIPVEEVTQEMLDNISVRVKGKIYSADGTTCHQCRQKTLDQKTCCRSPGCSGILGMFCGVCIKNRYGEDAAEALLNPNWICPVCRGKCNCSICRNRQGKRPTGILAPLAQQNGYESVDHFLQALRGEGDRPEDDYVYKLTRDPEALLGFSSNGGKVHFQDGSFNDLDCVLCSHKDCDNTDNLLE